MIFLLDTNACIAGLDDDPPSVNDRIERAIDAGDTVGVSAIVLAELWYGVAKSARIGSNSTRLLAFLVPLRIIAFDEEAAKTAGSIRAELARKGAPIGAYDCLIAGHAMRLGATLVTADTREFRRIQGLNCQDWTE
ncbi:MAG: type II toxin-antitoxin system VapC family toxin [Rhodospirillales bacterium]